jgi:hypothetical protein
VPDGISPIDAYRYWPYELDGLGGRLGEHVGGLLGEDRSAWEGASSSRWVKASCRPYGMVQSIHEAPLETCTCGFYAIKALLTLLSMLSLRDDAAGAVLGKVQLAGKIVEHEHGYRAERARIAELIPIRGTERDVRELGLQLGLKVGDPVVLYRNPSGDGPSSPQLGLRSWVRAPLDHGDTTAKLRLVA